jgi:DNA-binding transcriptional ArsR family regulator
MVAAANLVEVAALVGDTARATMLNALMGGQSLTATELAYCANVSRATASGHLSKLVAARLLTVTRQRRFSYYRIASPLVATMLESIKVVAAIEVPPRRQPRSAAVSKRRCTLFCPKLLRSPGWLGGSRGDRCTCCYGAHRSHR